ncbi:hypothetical protein HNQ92_001360 [Rhabdobacter roseus]|uniref:Carboxypeptidase-like regulatory domain-containing protein n=1 Tax=Rhabdobacter roseus TaxID=1655419 RepID=A0A840TIE1_9BACT|nr:hypothetical protein [Rhabdobacter roseus]
MTLTYPKNNGRWLRRVLAVAMMGYFASPQVVAQQATIRGKVIDGTTNQPLEFVSVYLNTTTIGTLTNEKGDFSIPARVAGKYELVVSMVGYEPIIYALDVNELPASFLFKLAPKDYALKGITVKAKRDQEWYRNLEVFKENFLGRGDLARQCKILNPEVLIIVFDPETGTLKVEAKDAIQIENLALGYKISYLLVGFEYLTRERFISYLGYPRYELITGNARQQRRWERNRLTAYHGSTMHFVRALRQQRLEEEGFNLRRLIRMPNPDRPSPEAFEQARAQLRARGDYDQVPEDDPIKVTLSKANLPEVLERLDTAKVPYQNYLQRDSSGVRMAFEGYFQVVYTGEKEEFSYIHSTSGPGPTRRPTFQTSVLSLQTEWVQLDELGEFNPPLGVFVEGYWGWEKVSYSLPFDYRPDPQVP